MLPFFVEFVIVEFTLEYGICFIPIPVTEAYTKNISPKEQRSSRSKTSGNSVKTKASPRSYVNYSQLSGGSRNRSRTSSLGSQGEFSDGGLSDSSYSRLRTYNRNSVRSSNRNNRSANSYMSSPDIPQKTVNRTKNNVKEYPFFFNIFCTPDNDYRTKRKRSVKNKENYVDSAGEDSDYYNGSAEISEIDARLSKLQQLMKSSID
ncbi:CCDC61 [Mytilus coruscus]|uniref:CCDC61 n=1 Tax=Mytilus coruscus TaxID=42192 RepID=A0A6J8EV93_MYTCO|nr:CCDC61 [Mytilus coruscus]